MGLITTPQQYLMVIETGKLEVMTDDVVNPEYVIKSENERLVSGEPVVAVFTDNHAMHIKEHAAVLADPELRFDQELVKRVDAHMQEHLNLLRTTDPQTLQMLGQQALGPIGGPPMNQNPQQMPPDASMQGQVPAMQGGPTVDQQMGVMPDPNIPQPAQPPMINGVPQPSTPEQMLALSTMGQQ
jgi:hypothetical protein